MNEILIGSSAIKHYFPDFPREPNDVDYISEDYKPNNLNDNSERTEYHLNSVFKDYGHSIILPNDLYTLKVSHAIGWDIKWNKNMWDINFLKNKGCTLNKPLFDKLYAYWNTIHGENRRSDLAMTAEDFFDNAMPKTYIHDDLHLLLNETPVYTKILKDGAEVEVSEDKFNTLSFEEKCDLVMEEVMVMSAERFHGLDYRQRYSKMLKKFILSHAPLWEALFIIENYVVLHKPKFNFIQYMNNELEKTGKKKLV